MPILTERENAILRLIAFGYQSKEIAVDLGVEPSALTYEVVILLKRMGAKTRAHAVALAKDRGII